MSEITEQPVELHNNEERDVEIEHNLKEVTELLEKHKTTPNCRLVCVSKTKPESDIYSAFNRGYSHFGENYLQELERKAKNLPKEIKWHFIGRLQSNKIKSLAAISNLWAVETIDSLEKAKKLNAAWIAQNPSTKLNIYVQVNTSEEPNKGGLEADDLSTTLGSIVKECSGLNLLGLMTIGSVENSNTIPNPDFIKLGALRDKYQSELGVSLEVSMGMSDDFVHALELGSNNIRVGSKIFGRRNYNA